ncbi:hypothetical protein KEM55_006827 [Ascosphaera atra]|nr:hypothetical protein KEM55_006827 [Ascosphaera atra]
MPPYITRHTPPTTNLLTIPSSPEIAEAAVVALPNEKFQNIVAAAIVLTPETARAIDAGEKKFGFMAVRNALQGKLAKYKVPKKLKVVERIPRNAMGKIMKKQIVKETFGVE